MLLLIFASQIASAFSEEVCNKFLNDGLYKTYKTAGLGGWAHVVHDEGFWAGTSVGTTEAPTIFLDPKWWSNGSTSSAQTTSSWGSCSPMVMNQLHEQREFYFVQNRKEIIREVAKGHGEHLETIAYFSMCEKARLPTFYRELQKRTEDLIYKPANLRYNDIIDQTISQEEKLRSACYLPNMI